MSLWAVMSEIGGKPSDAMYVEIVGVHGEGDDFVKIKVYEREARDSGIVADFWTSDVHRSHIDDFITVGDGNIDQRGWDAEAWAYRKSLA